MHTLLKHSSLQFYTYIYIMHLSLFLFFLLSFFLSWCLVFKMKKKQLHFEHMHLSIYLVNGKHLLT